jgi:hypothetical protein
MQGGAGLTLSLQGRGEAIHPRCKQRGILAVFYKRREVVARSYIKAYGGCTILMKDIKEVHELYRRLEEVHIAV